LDKNDDEGNVKYGLHIYLKETNQLLYNPFHVWRLQPARRSLLSNIIVRLSDGESENLERNDKHRTTEQSHQTF